jgi:hypothetical protein
MDGIGQLLKLLFVVITNVVVGAAVLLLGGFVAYRAMTLLWTEIRFDSGWGTVAYVKSLLQEPVALFESQQNAFAAGSGSYSELRWNPEDYFSDPKTLELCAAIVKKDIATAQRLIDEGVDVNAEGRDRMPLLLWSFSWGNEILELLLKNGADPNVVFASSYGARENLIKVHGASALYLAVETSLVSGNPKYDRYVETLLQYGADPNLGRYSCLEPASFFLSKGERETFRRLVEAGADVNAGDGAYLENVVGYGPELQLVLEHGAVYDVNTPQGRRLRERLRAYLNGSYTPRGATEEDRETTLKVVEQLKERGVSFDDVSAEPRVPKDENPAETSKIVR